MTRELFGDGKVGLGQTHFDNITASKSAITMAFGDKVRPNGGHSYQE